MEGVTPLRRFQNLAIDRVLDIDPKLTGSCDWLELAQLAGRSTAWAWNPKDDSLAFSSTTAEVFGIDRTLLPRTSTELLDFIPSTERGGLKSKFRAVLRTGRPFSLQHRFRIPGRGIVWAMVRGQAEIGTDGRISRVIGVSADITDSKRAEEELQREKERAQVTLASISDGVIRTDADGRIDYLNPAAEALLSVRLERVRGRQLAEIYTVRAQAGDRAEPGVVRQCLAGRHLVEPAEASLLRRPDGSEIWIRQSAAPIFDGDDELAGSVLVITDVTQLRALQQRMAHLASHDPLTGLINRREFELRLADAIGESGRGRRPWALCYLDLDEFKLVNDTCGHSAGDELLRQLTSVLDARIAEEDTLARLGGDEFGILFADCEVDDAEHKAHAVIEAVKQYRFQWNEQVFEIAASIGIVPVSEHGGNLPELLSAADSACYVAKDRGRNQIHVSTAGDLAVLTRHSEMRWVERINRALEENRFRLYRQPIRSLRDTTGRPQLNELLLRLVDVDGNVVTPSQFITAAERYRMMPVIDLWVVGAALEMIGGLHDGDELGRAVFTINLSGQSFGNAELHRLILRSLDRHAVPAHRVMFEITETAAIANLSQAIDFMNSLKERGCRFVLDDFGSGLSSFRYLRSLEVEYLKIDGELVRAIADDPIQREMVAAIHRIGESMGIQTIGEWVETAEIARTLSEIGVDYAQGYAVGHPVPVGG